MKIIIKNEEFKSKKLVGKLYELYLEISEKIDKYQKDNGVGWEKTSLKYAREFLVEYFDNKFTEEDLNEEVEVSTIITYFLLIDKQIQDEVTAKLEKIAKN